MAENRVPLRVLVIEDEFLVRWAISQTLAQAGYIVIEAHNGATAVHTLTNSAEPIDAVMLDCRLPDCWDLSLLATIRRLSPASAVILMSAYTTPEVTKDALELGAHRVIRKPFDMDELPPLLAQACRTVPQ